MSWNAPTRDTFEREVHRRVHRLALRATNGSLQGPELEAALLDLLWTVLTQNAQRGNPLQVGVRREADQTTGAP